MESRTVTNDILRKSGNGPSGWYLNTSAMEQMLWFRQDTEGLIHHNGRGSQYLSIRYTGRLVETRIESSVGNVGNSYDNALAETIIGLYKAVVNRKRARGVILMRWNTLRWNRWNVSTADACWNRLEIPCRLNMKRCTMRNLNGHAKHA